MHGKPPRRGWKSRKEVGGVFLRLPARDLLCRGDFSILRRGAGVERARQRQGWGPNQSRSAMRAPPHSPDTEDSGLRGDRAEPPEVRGTGSTPVFLRCWCCLDLPPRAQRRAPFSWTVPSPRGRTGSSVACSRSVGRTYRGRPWFPVSWGPGAGRSRAAGRRWSPIPTTSLVPHSLRL